MKQSFYDADGTKTGETSDGSVMARLKALEAKIRQLTGVKDPGPAKPAKAKGKAEPKPNPMATKKFADKRINPDTGDVANPGEPTVKYGGTAVGSGGSYHYDGASAGGPAGGPMPLGVPVNKGMRTMPAHHHMAGMADHSAEMEVGSNSALPLSGHTIVDSHMKP